MQLSSINPIETKILNRVLNIFNLQYKKIILSQNRETNTKINFWKIYRLHWEKNRFIFDLFYNKKILSLKIMKSLISNDLVDKELLKIWTLKGYEIVCSTNVLKFTDKTPINTSICRVPLTIRSRKTYLFPDSKIGCISCSSGDGINGKPIWWNTKIIDGK